MNTVTVPLHRYRQLLQTLVENPSRPIFLSAGVHHRPPAYEWLVQGIVEPAAAPPTFALFQVLWGAASLTLLPTIWPEGITGYLCLNQGRQPGEVRGVVRLDGEIQPIHNLFLVGAGMRRLRLADVAGSHRVAAAANGAVVLQQQDTDALYRQRWSRSISALGGEAVWQRLRRLRVGIVGCGRSGSLLVVSLARLGLGHLTLIDPDLVEPHNLGEMDAVVEADVGRPKVEAVADHLRAILAPFPAHIETVAAPIAEAEALAAAKACDVLACCADNDAARLVTAILATLYHKVLLDVGTGIFFQEAAAEGDGQRRMGADVRLVLPCDGCLLCQGSLSNYAGAVDELCRRLQMNEPVDNTVAWRQQRGGSLRSLNQLAVAAGMQMIQDLAGGRRRQTGWQRFELDGQGQLLSEERSPPAVTPCALCARAGLGDGALAI